MFATLLLFGLFNFSSTTIIQSNICGLPTTPTITAPLQDTVTTTQAILVSGQTTANSTINILDNNTIEASITADVSGAYGVDIQLSSGSNQIIAQAENSCNQTANSTTVDVTYNPPVNPTPPVTPSSGGGSGSVTVPAVAPLLSPHASSSSTVATISVPSASSSSAMDLKLNNYLVDGTTYSVTSTSTSPGPKITTSHSSIFINGSTVVPANIIILDNSSSIANIQSDQNGKFGVLIPLTVGDNHIEFIAKSGDKTLTTYLNVVRSSVATVNKAKTSLVDILALVAFGLVIFDGVYLITLIISNNIKNGGNL